MPTRSDLPAPYRVGEWLPSDQEFLAAWLEGLIAEVEALGEVTAAALTQPSVPSTPPLETEARLFDLTIEEIFDDGVHDA